MAKTETGPALLIRYGVVGAFNTAFSYGVYALFVWLGAPYPLASFIALVLGICLGFFTHGKLVFRSQLRGRFGRYVALWGVLYLCNIGLIAAILMLGTDPYTAGLGALPPTVLLSFWLQRTIVFR